VAFVDDRGPIRKAVMDKANAYGQFGMPYIIAIGAHDFIPDDIDVTNALFGSEQVAVRTYEDRRIETFPTRARDGAWIGPRGMQHLRVSGVLTAQRLQPWTVATTVPTFWHHPAAAHEFPIKNAPWREAVVDRSSGQLSFSDPVIRVADFFDLDERWPSRSPAFPRTHPESDQPPAPSAGTVGLDGLLHPVAGAGRATTCLVSRGAQIPSVSRGYDPILTIRAAAHPILGPALIRLDQRVRPALGGPCAVGKPRTRRGSSSDPEWQWTPSALRPHDRQIIDGSTSQWS
jgi:hypothetical protein